MKQEKGKLTAVDLDKRVRERNLASGRLEPKTLERHLAELPDLEGLAETVMFPQPALGENHDADDDGPGE